MMKNLFRGLLFSFCILIIGGCATSQNPSKSKDQFQRSPDVENLDPALGLIHHLRNVAGVQIYGSGANASITIRGINSINSGTEPLFVVNGQQVSGGLAIVSRMVPVQDIKSIRVLKRPDEIGIYGVRGANGVIEIELKRN